MQINGFWIDSCHLKFRKTNFEAERYGEKLLTDKKTKQTSE